MEYFYAGVIYVLIGVAILAMFYLKFQLIFKAKGDIEKIYRVIALSGGLLLFFGSKGSGVSIPQLLLTAVDSSGGVISNIVIYTFPAIVGSLATYFLFKSIKGIQEGDARLVYFVIIISTLISLTFSDIYVGSVVDNTANENIKVNVGFLLGVIFTLLFNIDIVGSLYEFIKGGGNNEGSTKKTEEKSWKDDY